MIPQEFNLDFDAFIRSFVQNRDTSFAFLLGAGASITSGIPSANDCIWDWKKQIFCSSQKSVPTFIDPKSDTYKNIIQKWLDSQGKFPPLGDSNEYSFYAEKALQIDDDRVKYFEHLAQGKQPYIGYKFLCLLNKYGIVKSIWTTNFDGLVERAAHNAFITPICINLDCADRIYRTESSNELLCISLHGDYKYSSLKNTSKELDSQHPTFVAALKRYFNDKNLIVIGYSGRDKSLMSALTEAFSEKGSGRIYWCGYGNEISSDVSTLLKTARNANREAFYIDTDGFDKTMLSLVSNCFSSDVEKQAEIKSIMESIPEENDISPFSIHITRTNKYLKSNLYPVIFPKELFQFEIEYKEEEKPWAFLRGTIKDQNIMAVPYKQKVYALSTGSAINNIFGSRLKGDIERIPVSIDDIEQNSSYRELFLRATLQSIATIRGLNVDIRHNTLWLPAIFRNDNGTLIHEAIECSLVFVPQQKYALLSMRPTIYIENSRAVSKEKKQEYARMYLDKMWNQAYSNKLIQWENIVFGNARLIFEFPQNSGSGFKFQISNNSGFSEIQYQDNTERGYFSRSYDNRRTIYRGLQLKEPELEFVNTFADRPFLDSNPMRGLSNHKPYDSWQKDVLPQNVRLGVICPHTHTDRFNSFLQRLNTTIQANDNSDYIQPYTGFHSIYKTLLEIPDSDTDKWIKTEDTPKDTINLAQSICRQAGSLADKYPGIVVVIYIPASWSIHKQFKHDGESFDLHNYIKAYAAQHSFTTQIIEEKTLSDPMVCEICWWLSLALFVKAMRIPWALASLDPDTAYAGIGYSVKTNSKGEVDIVLGCSHIYNAKGQGLRYKLSKVEQPQFDGKKNPYLTYEEAFKFGITIRELFVKSMDKLPRRVVIHKRTPFKKEEIEGITHALTQAGIKNIDLITINYEYNVKFIAQKVYYDNISDDSYPVSRGTCIKLSSRSALLWTHGVVPSIRNNRRYYPGGRCIPSPLKITKYYGKGDLATIASEIIGFTKMNWNSFNLYTKLPATIDTSNTLAQVGNLLHQYNGATYDYRYFI
ncbi:SIR2 family protein [Alistipes shahii]|uniref:SIR2 family protein n=1 Tax=Alistipes shahii TaxID=328814 RepID=UPI001E621911|nr:SIR2 family protein [Alistipes shahii]